MSGDLSSWRTTAAGPCRRFSVSAHALLARLLSLPVMFLVVPAHGDGGSPDEKMHLQIKPNAWVIMPWLAVPPEEVFDAVTRAGFPEIYEGAWWRDVEPERGRYDFEEVDFLLEEARERGIQVFVKVVVQPPLWWYRENPDEVPLFCNGEPSFDVVTGEGYSQSGIAYASERLREDYARFLEKLIGHIESEPFASAVAGYNVLENELGFPTSWSAPGGPLLTDYSPSMVKWFRAYLHERFEGDVNAMNEVLRTDYSGFEEVDPPRRRDDFEAAEGRLIWHFWMEARKKAQLEFFNEAIRAARRVTDRPVAGSELLSLAARPYSANYRRTARNWFGAYMTRGGYPKHYVSSEADLAPVNLYCENPAMLINTLSLVSQYLRPGQGLMIGEFNGFYRLERLQDQLDREEAAREVYRRGAGRVIPIEALTTYKHAFELLDVKEAYLHELSSIVNEAHQPKADRELRERTLREIARPFPLSLTRPPNQVLVDFTFEDVNLSPRRLHRNVDHYGRILASLGVAYAYGNSRDLSSDDLAGLEAVIVPADSTLDNAALEEATRAGLRIAVMCNGWSRSARTLDPDDSWIARNAGAGEEVEEGIVTVAKTWGGWREGDRFAVRRYQRWATPPDEAEVIATDETGAAVIVKRDNIVAVGLDLVEMAVQEEVDASMQHFRALLSGLGVEAPVEHPHRHVTVVPLEDGYWIFSPTGFGPDGHSVNLPLPRGASHWRAIVHDAQGRKRETEWRRAEEGMLTWRARPGENVVLRCATPRAFLQGP